MADGSVVIEVELTKEQLEKGLKSLKGDLGKLEKSSGKISDKLANGFESVGKASVNAGKKLTLGLTTPLIALGTAGVKYNAQMEDFEANLTTLLGNADKAKEMLESLKEMANTTPFETSDLLESTQMMLGFGLAADKTKGYLQTLGDISMGNKEKLMSLTRAFSQMGASGKATMEDINQMIDAGFNPLQIMAESTGKSMATLREEVSKGKISFEDVSEAMKIATSEGGRYYKAMEKASQTMNGKLSTAIDALKTSLGKLTESLLPIVTKVVEKITEWANAFSNLDKKTQETILKLALVVTAIGPILIIFGKVANGISSIIKVITKLKTALTAGGTAIKALSSAFTFLTGPVGIVIGIISSVIALLTVLYNKSETFRNAVNKAFEQIKNSLLKAWETIKPALEKLGQAFGVLLEKLAPVGEFLINVLSVAFTVLANVLSVIITILANVITELVNFVTNIITFFTETIPNAWNEFITGLQNLAITIWNTLVNAWNTVVSFFTEGIPNFIKSVIQWFQELPYKIGLFIGEILGNIIKFGQDVWNWVTVELPKIIQSIIDWFAKLPENIWNWLVETFNKIVAWGQNTYNTAVQWVSNTINAIINWFKELPNKVWTWLQNTINNVITWGREMTEKGRQGAVDLFNNIVNTITGLPQKMLDIGKNIVQGLWDGIVNAKNWMVNKVQSFARGILDGIKGALGIHSPSRVFRDEVGRYIALGVGEGFTKNIDDVYKNMKSTVEFETQKLNANLTSNAIVEVQRNSNIQTRLESLDNNKEIVVKAETNLDGKVLTSTVNRVNARQKLQYGIA